MLIRRRRRYGRQAWLADVHHEKTPGQYALELDGHLRRLAPMHNQIRFLIGLALGMLREKKAFTRMGFATLACFAVQDLGMPVGQALEIARVATELRHRPVTLQRHLSGQISYGVVRLLLRGTPRELEDPASSLFVGLTVGEADEILTLYKRLVEEARAATRGTDEPNPNAKPGKKKQPTKKPTSKPVDRRLEALARRAAEAGASVGSDVSDEEPEQEEGRVIEFLASPGLAARLFVAVDVARCLEGVHLPLHACLEMWGAELMSGPGADALLSLGHESPDWFRPRPSGMPDADVGGPSPDGPVPPAAGPLPPRCGPEPACSGSMPYRTDAGSSSSEAGPPPTDAEPPPTDPLRQARNRERALDRAFWKEVERDIHKFNDHWRFLDWSLPQLENLTHLAPDNDTTLEDLLRRLRALRDLDMRVGKRLREGLWRFHRARCYLDLEFVDIAHYAEERLHMSRSAAKALVTLEVRLQRFDQIRCALDRGLIRENQAALLVTIATPQSEQAWVEHARQTTVRFLRDDVHEAEQMRVFDPERFARTHGVPSEMATRARAAARARGRGAAAAGQTCATGAGGGECEIPYGPGPTCAAGAGDGEGETPDGPGQTRAAGDGEGETPDGPGPTCAAGDASGEAETQKGCTPPRRMLRRSPLPLPVFRQRLQLVLDDVRGRYDDDPFKGAHMRMRLWIPASFEPFLQDLIDTACAVLGGWGGFAEALELCIDAFLSQWGDEVLQDLRKHPILARDGCRCAVPTCGRRGALHVHHIVYRSRGGDNDATNLVTLCEAHHLHGVHEGRVRVAGQAPDGLLWELGVQPDGTSTLVVYGRSIVAPLDALAAVA